MISYVHRNKSPYICHIRQSNFLLWNKFCYKKNVSGTTRFPLPPPSTFSTHVTIKSYPPATLHVSHVRNIFIFFCFDPVSQFTNYSQNLSSVALYNFKHSPCIECHSHGWRLNTGLTVMENCICPHFLHQTQIISMIDFMTPNFSHFPQVTDCGIFLEIVDVRMF